MKIKILKTGQIVEGFIDRHGMCLYLFNGDANSCHSDNIEIIPEPRQPKFQIGDKVVFDDDSIIECCTFKIYEIRIYENYCNYYDNEMKGYAEKFLSLYTESEPPKTFKYVECGELSGEKIYKKVEE